MSLKNKVEYNEYMKNYMSENRGQMRSRTEILERLLFLLEESLSNENDIEVCVLKWVLRRNEKKW